MLPDHHIRRKLQDKVVGIAGCGGLGSNCAVALARAGVGKLIIADYDVVELSNLNRQYFFRDQIGQKKSEALKDIIYKIDRDITVEPHDIFLSAENIPALFSGCHVIVEAFDRAEMKMMIMETVSQAMKDIPLVCGMGLAGWGSNETLGLERYDNVYVCGDREMETSEEYPPLAPRVGVVAGMQANTVMEILLGKMK